MIGSSPSQVFFRIAIHTNFTKFHNKTPVLESLFNKLLHRCFPVKFVRFLRTTFNKAPPVAAPE